jgi:hypothetical protein
MAMLFPSVRPRDPVVEAFAERVATEFETVAPHIPQERIEEGVALLDATERHRIVDDLRGRYPDRWASLVADSGDELLTERAVVASAVLGAVLERVPVSRELLELVHAMPLPASPAGVVVVLVDPHLVWDRDDAILIGRMVPRGREAMQFWSEAHALAERRVDASHIVRVRELAERIGAQLPAEGLERATEIVGAGIAEVRDDETAAAWVAGALLAGYAHLVYLGKIERR